MLDGNDDGNGQGAGKAETPIDDWIFDRWLEREKKKNDKA
jgi:hypothetical protein